MMTLYILMLYFFIGIITAFWFSFFKVYKIDEGAIGAPFGFRLIIIPATILLWPLVLQKIRSHQKEKQTIK